MARAFSPHSLPGNKTRGLRPALVGTAPLALRKILPGRVQCRNEAARGCAVVASEGPIGPYHNRVAHNIKITCRNRTPVCLVGVPLLHHFHADFHAVMFSGGGGEVADGHDGIAAVAEEPAHVAFIHPDIEHVALANFAAADVGLLRTAGEARHNITDKILNSGDRLHKVVGVRLTLLCRNRARRIRK